MTTKLHSVDAGLGAAAEFLLRIAPPMMHKNVQRYVDAVAHRLLTLEAERDNLYALAATRFDKAELDEVLRSTRRAGK